MLNDACSAPVAANPATPTLAFLSQPPALWRPGPAPSPSPSSAAVPVCTAPAPKAEHAGPELRFATQPIKDLHDRVVATELLFRWNSMDADISPLLGAYATATVLCNALIDGQWLSQPGRADAVGSLYINMDEGFLMSPMAEAMTPDIGVIELLETLRPTAEVCRRIGDLHRRGFRFSLDDVDRLDDPRWLLASFAETVKIDLMSAPRDLIKPLIIKAREAGARVVVEKVQSAAEVPALATLGAELFQGYGIERPTVHRVQALPGCDARLLGRLYLMALEGASPQAMAFLAESDPATAARLLRLQALVAPGEVGVSADLAAVLASIPRPSLTGWLAQMNVAALHGRGRACVEALRNQMACFRAGLRAASDLAPRQQQAQVFQYYREQLLSLGVAA